MSRAPGAQEMMTGTYARSARDQTTAGGVILTVVSCLAAVLVIGGLFYAAGASGRHKAALAAAGCEPNLSPSGLQCTTAKMLASQFARVTAPALQQLTTDAAAYTASERHHLVAAEAALRAEVTAENALDASLARFPFPPASAPEARTLIEASQARAKLIAEQARSSSLPRLRSFNGRVSSAGATVDADMKLVRTAVGARPAASQEP